MEGLDPSTRDPRKACRSDPPQVRRAPKAPFARHPGATLEHACLAQPGSRLENEQPTTTATGAVQKLGKRHELGLTLEQSLHRRSAPDSTPRPVPSQRLPDPRRSPPM